MISLSPTAAGEATTAPRRRGVELALLAFAVVLVITADVVVDATFNDTVSSAVWTYGAGFALIYAVAHVAVRWLAPYADPLILPAVALLNGLGLVLIRQGRFKEAIEALRRNIKLQPFSPYGYYQLGMTYHHLGNAAEAQEIHDELQKFEPKYAATLTRDMARTMPRADQRSPDVPLHQEEKAAGTS